MNESRLSWFALSVRSNHERAIAAALESRGFQHFLPTYRERRRWSDRYQDVDVPLFPGYVFSRFNLHHRQPIVTLFGLISIVGIGKSPSPVDDREIASLQLVAASHQRLKPWPFLTAGDRVLLQEGPLSGVEGIIIREKGIDQLVLSVTLLQRSVAVTLNRGWVRPLHLAAKCAHPRLAAQSAGA